jgi:hypothetical protein
MLLKTAVRYGSSDCKVASPGGDACYGRPWPEAARSSSKVPWFGARPGNRFDAPLLNALAALFGLDEDEPRKGR